MKMCYHWQAMVVLFQKNMTILKWKVNACRGHKYWSVAVQKDDGTL